MTALAQEKPEYRGQYYVERCDEARLSDSGIFDAVLLEHARCREGESAADASDDCDLPIYRLALSSEKPRFFEP